MFTSWLVLSKLNFLALPWLPLIKILRVCSISIASVRNPISIASVRNVPENLCVLNKIKHFLPKTRMYQLYCSLIVPIQTTLFYSGGVQVRNISRIVQIQKRALRITSITSCTGSVSFREAFLEVGLTGVNELSERLKVSVHDECDTLRPKMVLEIQRWEAVLGTPLLIGSQSSQFRDLYRAHLVLLSAF